MEGSSPSKKGTSSSSRSEGIDGLEFEDPYADEFEEEEYDDAAIEKEDMEDYEGDGDDEATKDEDSDEDGYGDKDKKQVWRPGIDSLKDGEHLEHDPSAYTMYHSLSTEWPCLSFDIIRDNLGDARQRFPHTMFMVCGSQADRSSNNKVTILKMSDLHKTGGQPGEYRGVRHELCPSSIYICMNRLTNPCMRILDTYFIKFHLLRCRF